MKPNTAGAIYVTQVDIGAECYRTYQKSKRLTMEIVSSMILDDKFQFIAKVHAAVVDSFHRNLCPIFDHYVLYTLDSFTALTNKRTFCLNRVLIVIPYQFYLI